MHAPGAPFPRPRLLLLLLSRAWGDTYLAPLIAPRCRSSSPRLQRRRGGRDSSGGPGPPPAAVCPCTSPPGGLSPGTLAPRLLAAPFNFRDSPRDAIPDPLHVNAPRSQWARPGREPSTNGRGGRALEELLFPLTRGLGLALPGPDQAKPEGQAPRGRQSTFLSHSNPFLPGGGTQTGAECRVPPPPPPPHSQGKSSSG